MPSEELVERKSVLALGLLPDRPRTALRAIRAVRGYRPEAVLRYPPSLSVTLLGYVLREPASAGTGPDASPAGSGAWVVGSDALLVPEFGEPLLPVIAHALENDIPVLVRESPTARQALGFGVVYLSPEAKWSEFWTALERLEGDAHEREAVTRRGRVQGRHLLRHLRPEPRGGLRQDRPDEAPPLSTVDLGEWNGPSGRQPIAFSSSSSESSGMTNRASRFRRLSVVLALHGQRRLTEACLRTLRADLAHLESDQEAEIVCVDNASPDDTREWLRRQSDLHLVLLPENRGCPGGWNAGLSAATGDVLCVLNNDTLIHPGGIRRLARAAWETGIAAMAGGVLNERLEFVRMTADPAESDYPDGCALAFRRDVFEAVGPFDEGMGLGYCEDSDWGIRARSRGYKWAIVSDVLTHLGGQTAQRLPEIAAAQVRNAERLRRRWGGRGIGERLLVKRTGAIGDVLMATPALASLRRQRPLARIYLQCAAPIAELLHDLPILDGASPEEPGSWTERWDLDDAYERYERAGEFRHPAFAFADVLDVPIRPEPYRVPACSEFDAWAAEMLPHNNEAAPEPVYIACGLRSACRPEANWGEANWRALASRCPELTFVLLDGEPRPSLECSGCYDGAALYDLPNVRDLTGRTQSLRQVVALLRRCRACISVDTGMLHLAATANLPTVGLMASRPSSSRAPLKGLALLLDSGEFSTQPPERIISLSIIRQLMEPECNSNS